MNEISSKVLFLQECNFTDYPTGGELSFARQMLEAFGTRLALAGISTQKNEKVGEWQKKTINGLEYDFFPFHAMEPASAKPLIPARISTYLSLRRHRKAILSANPRHVFMSSQQLLVEVAGWRGIHVCYRFPGTENPLNISRYPWARMLARTFDAWFFAAVQKADLILAAADQTAISDLALRSRGLLQPARIVSFPTRIDTRYFHPGDKTQARTQLSLPQNKKIAATSGRIHWAKGWDFLVHAFQEFCGRDRDSILLFIGDGEDRPRLEEAARTAGLQDNVIITGRLAPPQVSGYLKASDLFVMGSLREGWSTSLIEALGCALPIVTTKVSSADAIVKNGVNGFVVEERDPVNFANAMRKALTLAQVRNFSMNEVEKYTVNNLARDIARLWPPLSR